MKYVFLIYLQIYSLWKCFGSPNSSSYETSEISHGLYYEKIETIQQSQIPTENWRPWISKIFSEAEEQFTIHSEASAKCKQDFNLYELHLKNHSLWAIRMAESSEWPRLAILMGMKPYVGHFDECTMVNAYNIRGKHCTVENEIRFKEFDFVRPKYLFDAPPEEGSAWQALQMYEHDEYRIQRNLIQWSLCIPSSCTELDLNTSLTQTLNRVFGKYSIDVKTDVKNSRCQIHPKENDSVEYYYVVFLFSLMILLVMFSSIFMQFQEKNITDQRLHVNLAKCFSIQENYSKFVKIVPERELMLIQVIRVIISVGILIVHRFMYTISYIHYNANFLEQVPHPPKNAILSDPLNILFFISGALTCTAYIKFNENNVGILEYIGKRWFRLFPTYIFIRLLYTFILPAVGSGPLWYQMQNEADFCKTNLLRALLTLPSERNRDTMCYPASWGIPVDFQLSVIGYIYLTLCKHFKVNKLKSLSIFMLFSIMTTFCYIFYNQYLTVGPIPTRPLGLPRNREGLMNQAASKFMSSYHFSVITRSGPYIMGMLFALIASELKERRYVFPKVLIFCGLIVAECARIAAGVSYYRLYEQFIMKEYNRVWQAGHAAFVPTLHILSYMYLLLVYFVNGFEYLEKRIPRIIIYLGRLSFVADTLHTVLMHFHIFSRRTLTSDPDPYSSLYLLISDMVLTYALAFIIHLVIEAPIQRLYGLLTFYMRRDSSRLFKKKDDVLMKNE